MSPRCSSNRSTALDTMYYGSSQYSRSNATLTTINTSPSSWSPPRPAMQHGELETCSQDTFDGRYTTPVYLPMRDYAPPVTPSTASSAPIHWRTSMTVSGVPKKCFTMTNELICSPGTPPTVSNTVIYMPSSSKHYTREPTSSVGIRRRLSRVASFFSGSKRREENDCFRKSDSVELSSPVQQSEWDPYTGFDDRPSSYNCSTGSASSYAESSRSGDTSRSTYSGSRRNSYRRNPPAYSQGKWDEMNYRGRPEFA
ncbi:hypothetical protein CYLTODRAFT_455409 [Cylindrobasidium torrendii FP15055 ss-10]|uniref:Uncharacterized protein n=1 Tax=Cylindrobasidium torrendii FP15055 ss-10 TaxID=1314674 RepID=A0A0D7BA26_9AGAR|nr:hypothetical protein CYLTODRAFT_455409 [Cylindrobasidium torrendii FP15055 ss-10]